MAFDLALLKEHPYATGAVVIVGGIVVLYLLSSSGGSSAPASSSGNVAAVAQADAQIAQINAAAGIQQQQTQAQLQVAGLQAGVSNYQTQASLEANQTSTAAQLSATLAGINAGVTTNRDTLTAQTVQQANQYAYAENTTSMQDQVLESQINSGVIENANNNATGLAATEANLNAQYGIASQTIAASYGLATQQNTNFETNVQDVLPLLGKQYNSALDANNANAGILTILSGGNPGVATSGTSSSAAVAGSANAANAAIIGSISSGISNLAKGFFG